MKYELIEHDKRKVFYSQLGSGEFFVFGQNSEVHIMCDGGCLSLSTCDFTQDSSELNTLEVRRVTLKNPLVFEVSR